MTSEKMAYLSQADGGTRTPDPFITSDCRRSSGGSDDTALSTNSHRDGTPQDATEQTERPQNAPSPGDIRDRFPSPYQALADRLRRAA